MSDVEHPDDGDPEEANGKSKSSIDVHVGGRIRMRRTLLGLSQSALAKSMGISFQQIQKYERGTNRIPASRLHQLSLALDSPLSFFFDNMVDVQKPVQADTATLSGVYRSDRVFANDIYEQLSTKEALELVRVYYRIKRPDVRRRVLDLIRSLSQDEV